MPPDSPVRSKTLFASTRATLVRDLGSEKFADTVFAVDPADVLEPNAWRERDGDRAGSRGRDGETGGQGEEDEEEALTEHERQLREVRRQESEERSMGMGMGKRDTGVGGEVGGGADTALRLEDGLVDALLEMHAEEGKVVVLVSDILFLYVYGVHVRLYLFEVRHANYIFIVNADHRREHRDLCRRLEQIEHLASRRARPHLQHQTPVHVLSLSRLLSPAVHLHVSDGRVHQRAHAERELADCGPETCAGQGREHHAQGEFDLTNRKEKKKRKKGVVSSANNCRNRSRRRVGMKSPRRDWTRRSIRPKQRLRRGDSRGRRDRGGKIRRCLLNWPDPVPDLSSRDCSSAFSVSFQAVNDRPSGARFRTTRSP